MSYKEKTKTTQFEIMVTTQLCYARLPSHSHLVSLCRGNLLYPGTSCLVIATENGFCIVLLEMGIRIVPSYALRPPVCQEL